MSPSKAKQRAKDIERDVLQRNGTSDFPRASLPVGQTLNVDLKQRGAIDKVYLRCDQGRTANVDLWVVK